MHSCATTSPAARRLSVRIPASQPTPSLALTRWPFGSTSRASRTSHCSVRLGSNPCLPANSFARAHSLAVRQHFQGIAHFALLGATWLESLSLSAKSQFSRISLSFSLFFRIRCTNNTLGLSGMKRPQNCYGFGENSVRIATGGPVAPTSSANSLSGLS